MRADSVGESVGENGPINVLAMRCSARMDVQQTRLALEQRGLTAEAEAFKKVEEKMDRDIKKDLESHIVWPWLSEYKGLGGVQVARLIALIGDPRRFPGQKCSVGHTSVPDYAVGDPCPWVGIDKEAVCEGTMLPPRETTGVRSLWHYLGLHAVDGKSPKRAKGQRADWSPTGRTTVLMPGGIADAIVRSKPKVYREEYERQKERLARERGVVLSVGIDRESGADTSNVSEECNGAERVAASVDRLGATDGSEVESWTAIEPVAGLRPIQIDRIARKIAAKRFVGDLLVEWKKLAEYGPANDVDRSELA